MSTIRQQRLIADEERLRALLAANRERISLVSAEGRPPERYVLQCHCVSVVALQRGRARFGDTHVLRVLLPPDYPLGSPPRAYIDTPIRHPHVFTSRQEVCIGHKRVITEYLDAFVARMFDLLRYDPDNLNPLSPADTEALTWALKHRDSLPLDTHALVLPSMGAPAEPTIVWKDRS